MPNLVAYDLAGVQPMSGPTGLIFAMRSRYGTDRTTGTEAFYNEADTAFSGQNNSFDLTGFHSDGAAGMGTTGQSGTNPSVLNPVGSATSTDYNVGQGMQTSDAEALGGAAGDHFNEMNFSIEKVTVTAKSRALKAEYSLELAQDLRAIHGLNAENLNSQTFSPPRFLLRSTAKSSEPSTRLLSRVLFLTLHLLVLSTSTSTPTVVGLLRSSRV